MPGNVIRRIRIMQRYSRYAWTNFYARVCVCVCIHTCYSQEIARARANLQWISPSFLFFFRCVVVARDENENQKKKKNYNGRLFCTATIIRTKYAWLPTCRRHLPRRTRLHLLPCCVTIPTTITTFLFFPSNFLDIRVLPAFMFTADHLDDHWNTRSSASFPTILILFFLSVILSSSRLFLSSIPIIFINILFLLLLFCCDLRLENWQDCSSSFRDGDGMKMRKIETFGNSSIFPLLYMNIHFNVLQYNVSR